MKGPGGAKPNGCCCRGKGINGGVDIGIGIATFSGILLGLLLTSLEGTCNGVLFLITLTGCSNYLCYYSKAKMGPRQLGISTL